MARRNRIPFASTTSVSLSYVAASFAGAGASFDTARLVNSFRVPLEIRAIRILIEPRPTEVVTDLILAPYVRIEAKLGKHYLTDGPVPVSILAPYKVWEQSLEAFPIENDFTQLSMRTIVLPRPLYLNPGCGFSARASIPADEFTTGAQAFNSNFTVNVHVAILGQFMGDGEKIPGMHEVPIVSFAQFSSIKRRSFETELRNPLSKRIRVHRLTGTKLKSHTPGNEVLSEDYDNSGTSLGVDLRFPDDSPLSENTVEFSHLFGQMRTLPVTFDLEENSRLSARIVSTETAVRGYQIGLFATRSEVVQ